MQWENRQITSGTVSHPQCLSVKKFFAKKQVMQVQMVMPAAGTKTSETVILVAEGGTDHGKDSIDKRVIPATRVHAIVSVESAKENLVTEGELVTSFFLFYLFRFLFSFFGDWWNTVKNLLFLKARSSWAQVPVPSFRGKEERKWRTNCGYKMKVIIWYQNKQKCK